MRVCPTGAMHKDADTGLVSVDVDAASDAVLRPFVSLQGSEPRSLRGTQREMRWLQRPRCAGGKPICVEALRALDFGDIEQLRSDFGDVAAIVPLPDSSATRPNIVITPPAAACADVAGNGAVLNRCEIV